MSSILLLSPPLHKACEPPASLAFLAGALPEHLCTTYDLNLEGQLWLLGKMLERKTAEDTWSKRAIKNGRETLQQLRAPQLYTNYDRYKRAVMDINKLLSLSGEEANVQLSLNDYQSEDLSPLSIHDLLLAAERYTDNIFYPFFAEKCAELIAMKAPQWIGISLNFLSQALPSFALIGWLRKEHPEIKIITGGGLVTTWLSHPAWRTRGKKLEQLTFFVKGQGESVLQELLGAGNTNAPLPNYTHMTKNYLAPGFILPYTTSRGCFWRRCSFCPETAEQSRYQHTPPETTMQQLQKLCARYQPRLIHFLDNALSPTTLTALADSALAVPWYGFARFDPPLADPGFCKKLRASGCVMLKLGLESGDQQVLDEMKKGISLSQVTRILTNLAEAGIATYIYLLFGTPAEDREAAAATLDYVAAHSGLIGHLNLAIFNMPYLAPERKTNRGDEMHHNQKEELSIYTGFDHPKGWERGDIRRFLGRQFRKHPAIAPALQRVPPFFTSNHAAFFTGAMQKREESI